MNEMQTRLIRMAVDMLVPVGERAGMIQALMEGLTNIREAKEKADQALAELSAIREMLDKMQPEKLEEIADTVEETSEEVEVAAAEAAVAADNTDALLAEVADDTVTEG